MQLPKCSTDLQLQSKPLSDHVLWYMHVLSECMRVLSECMRVLSEYMRVLSEYMR
jgi:hypothetical protein